MACSHLFFLHFRPAWGGTLPAVLGILQGFCCVRGTEIHGNSRMNTEMEVLGIHGNSRKFTDRLGPNFLSVRGARKFTDEHGNEGFGNSQKFTEIHGPPG